MIGNESGSINNCVACVHAKCVVFASLFELKLINRAGLAVVLIKIQLLKGST